MNKTLVILKPDCVYRGLCGYVISQFEQRFIIETMEKVHLTAKQTNALYKKYKDKPFFPNIMTFMTSGPVVIMVLSGEDTVIVDRARDLALKLREKLKQDVSENTIHSSDSPEAAKREIGIFYDKNDSS